MAITNALATSLTLTGWKRALVLANGITGNNLAKLTKVFIN
jgi:hypothetical protein